MCACTQNSIQKQNAVSECSLHAGESESTFESTIGSTAGVPSGATAPADTTVPSPPAYSTPLSNTQQQPSYSDQQQYHPSSQLPADTQMREGSTVGPLLGVQQPGPPGEQHPGPPAQGNYLQQPQQQQQQHLGGQSSASIQFQHTMPGQATTVQQSDMSLPPAQDHQAVSSEHAPDPQPQVCYVAWLTQTIALTRG